MAQGVMIRKKGTGGSGTINGIIEEYKVASGNNISAGDFVSYINNYNNNHDILDNNFSGECSAVMLANDKVFIAYGSYSTSADTDFLYGIICTISDTSITIDTTTQLSNRRNSGYSISAILLDNNTIFIAHSYYGSGSYLYRLYGMICTISGTTITAGTDTSISTTKDSGQIIQMILLDTNKVFISHSSSASSVNRRLYGIVCNISGTTITAGTDTALNDSAGAANGHSITKIANTKVFISFNYSSHLYGLICTISGTTITTGTATQLSQTTATGYETSTILLNENKIFIAYSYSSYYYLYGLICTISGTTITASTDTQLSNMSYSATTIAVIKLSDNQVFIAHTYNDNYVLGIMLCTISETIIVNTDEIIIDNKYSGYKISTILLNDNIFICSGGGGVTSSSVTYRDLYGIIGILEEQVKSIISENDEIFGVAKQSRTSGNTIEVYVPDIQEV